VELTDEWVTGFVDGEGCFYVGINPHPEMTQEYQVLPEFRVVQHERDKQVLHALKRFFRSGVVRRNHEDRWELRIRKLEQLRRLVDFFERHPLKTKKQVDFKRFAKVIRMMERGDHLTREGLIRILEVTCRMNRGEKRKAEAVLKTLRQREETG